LTGVFIGSLDDKPGGQSLQRLLPDASSVHYAGPSAASRTGHVVFSRENTLMAQPFDALSLKLSGDPVPISAGVSSYGGFHLSSIGALAYIVTNDLNRRLAWFDRKGQHLGDVWKPGPYGALELSPDGTRVVADRGEGQASDVWVYEFARNAETQITASPARDGRPVWLDNERVVYYSARDGQMRLFTRAASGAGPEDVLAEFEPEIRAPLPQTVSPDGRILIFEPGRFKTGRDLMILPLENGKAGKPSEYLNSEGSEFQAQFSPDGRYVAYHLNQSGNNELQVSTFPDPQKRRWTISSGGGYQPRWSKDGRELLYFAPGGKLMSVQLSLSPEFRASAPKLLFERPIFGSGVSGNQIRWDLTRDGQRFLINTSSSDESGTPITVVLNWQAAVGQ
jgi:eukaryotic-like serine/threonine-protein kinase